MSAWIHRRLKILTADQLGRLATVAQQIRLDRLTVEVCEALASQGIPHAVIKGVTTARWLYDPPRSYSDVDLLVPLSRVHHAGRALIQSGVASPKAGRYGEAAAHSQLFVATNGAEIDVHGSLPAMDGLGAEIPDQLWAVLAEDLVAISLDGNVVPALSLPSQCVVLGMHAVASAPSSGQVAEDLRRARAMASDEVWAEAFRRAESLQLAGHIGAALNYVHGRSLSRDLPNAARLHLTGAPSAAIQMTRLRNAGLLSRARIAAEKAFPSKEFMHHADPSSIRSPWHMTVARLRRSCRILRQLATLCLPDR